MSYTAKHKAAGRYGVVDEAGNYIADFLGSKDEAEAKANELNQGNSKNDAVASSENQTSSSDKGDSNGDDSRAHAPFSDSENQTGAVVPEIAQVKEGNSTGHAVGGNTSSSVKKKPVLTDKGWLV